MNLDGDASTDEYYVTAMQIFEYCGADNTGTLRVDVLMEKFAPFVKSNKAEFGTKIAELKSLLDPYDCNPEITVSKLAMILNKYSDSQRIKVDLEESFNLKGEQAPHDSDSGISTDGFQLLEELQCELREKCHQVHQLRSQLDFTDRQHEEALAAVSAERDALRVHLNMLREENMTLTHVRRDYEETCEQLCGCERALEDARREMDAAKRRAKSLQDQIALLETEQLTLQEQLTRSKEECHRINEMYARRQTALRQENETFRAEHAELSTRLQDQEFMQQLIKEKVLLEMELKEVLNKSNQTHLRIADRSIEVSYTEDQMPTELDSLNANSRFVQEHHLLDEESFINALGDDLGRSTSMSLFHELRLSVCNMSRNNLPEKMALATVATQTDEAYNVNELNDASDRVENKNLASHNCKIDPTSISVAIQTDANERNVRFVSENKVQFNFVHDNRSISTQCDHFDSVNSACTELDVNKNDFVNNNNTQRCIECSNCMECERLTTYTLKLEKDVKNSQETVSSMHSELAIYEDNLNVLRRVVDEGNERNKVVDEFVDSLKAKVFALEAACDNQRRIIHRMSCTTSSVLVQTECELSSVSTQAELPCLDCVSKKATSNRSLKNLLWEPLKWLFQLFAVVCFACAVCALYTVTSRARAVCRDAPAVPWRWLHAQDLLDLLLRIEYVAEVPM